MSAPVILGESVADCMERVRAAVNDCVEENGYHHARTAAYWRLGIDPMPSVGHVIAWGTMHGLPTGSVVRLDWRGVTSLWTVVKNEINPARLDQVSEVYATTPYAETGVEIVLRAPWEAPTWEHANQFLHAVWQLQRRWRLLYNWCNAVERALVNADLDDPGDTPPVPAQTEGALVVGYRVEGTMSRQERAAFEAAPDGTVAAAPGVLPRIKQGERWLRSATLVPDSHFYDYSGVFVVALP